MADISQIEVNGTTYQICDATARDSLDNKVDFSPTSLKSAQFIKSTTSNNTWLKWEDHNSNTGSLDMRFGEGIYYSYNNNYNFSLRPNIAYFTTIISVSQNTFKDFSVNYTPSISGTKGWAIRAIRTSSPSNCVLCSFSMDDTHVWGNIRRITSGNDMNVTIDGYVLCL